MVTFKDLQTANTTIKTTNIKGKEYAEVPQRIKAFRMLYPQGSIMTQMLSNENGVCVMKARVSIIEEGQEIILGEGTAYEKEDSSFINKTSYIENCETSAVGRALGMAGFGIDTSVASAEEVQNAILNQVQDGEIANSMFTSTPSKTFICADCVNEIKGVRSGKRTMTAEDVANKGIDAYGEPLCLECYRRRQNEANENISQRTF